MAKHSRVAKAQRRLPPVPKVSPPIDLLLDLVVDEFLYACQQTSSSSATLRSYRGVLRVFHDYLTLQVGRPPRLGDVTLSAVQQWAVSLQQRPKWERGGLAVGTALLSVETRRTYLRTLRTFSNWLPKEPHCFTSEPPLKHLRLPHAPDTFKLPLTDEELGQLIAAAKEDSVFGVRDTAMLLLLIDGAVRAMELAQMRIGDVTLQTGLLLVARGKRDKTRAVTVGEETRLALRRYAVLRDSRVAVDRSPASPFFQTTNGGGFTYYGLRSWLRRLAERAGTPRAHLHLFRHTSAVDTLDAGADVRTVQLKLGHASITTTQRYLHMATERMSERQKEFSPVDRLKLTNAKKAAKSAQAMPLWRRSAARERSDGNVGRGGQ